MKKILVIILALITALPLYSCSDDGKKSDQSPSKHSSDCELCFNVTLLDEEGKVMSSRNTLHGYLCLSCGIDIPPIYSGLSDFSPNGLALAIKDGKCLVINTEGEKVLDLPYDDFESLSIQYGCFKVCKDGKWGVINIKGEVLIPVKYDDCDALDDKCNYFKVKKGEKWGIGKAKGETPIPLDYDSITSNPHLYKGRLPEDLRIVEKDGKHGLINLKGKTIIPIEYSSIGCNASVITATTMEWMGDEIPEYTTTVFDMTGKKLAVIPYNIVECFETTFVIKQEKPAEYDEDGNRISRRQILYGLVNIDGEVLVSPEHRGYNSVDNYWRFRGGEGGGYYYKDGTLVLDTSLYSESEIGVVGDCLVVFNYAEDETTVYYKGKEVARQKVTDFSKGDAGVDGYGDWLFVRDNTEDETTVYYKGVEVAKHKGLHFESAEQISNIDGENLEYLLLENKVRDPETGSKQYSVIDSKGKLLVDSHAATAIGSILVDGLLLTNDYYLGFGAINLKGEVVKEPTFDNDDGFFNRFTFISLRKFSHYNVLGMDSKEGYVLLDEEGNNVLGEKVFILQSFVYKNEEGYAFQRQFGGTLEILNSDLETVATYTPSYERALFSPDRR